MGDETTATSRCGSEQDKMCHPRGNRALSPVDTKLLLHNCLFFLSLKSRVSSEKGRFLGEESRDSAAGSFDSFNLNDKLSYSKHLSGFYATSTAQRYKLNLDSTRECEGKHRVCFCVLH